MRCKVRAMLLALLLRLLLSLQRLRNHDELRGPQTQTPPLVCQQRGVRVVETLRWWEMTSWGRRLCPTGYAHSDEVQAQ